MECCRKITEAIAKASLLIMAVTLLGLTLTHYKVQSYSYLEAAKYLIVYNILVVLYVLLYVTTLGWVLLQYWTKGKLCFPTSCMFMAASLAYATLGWYQAAELFTESADLLWQMNQGCLNSSILQQFEEKQSEAVALLCTEACPCNLAINTNTNYTISSNGAYNV